MKIGTLLRLGLPDVAVRGRLLDDLYGGRGRDAAAVARPSYDEVAGQARDLETAGFDAVYTIESSHDVFLPLALAGAATGLEIMTNVAVALPRGPLHLAHAAYDLQLVSRGRFLLGLGSGTAGSQPVERMRETVLAVKAIFATWQDGVALDFRGEFTTQRFMNPAFNPGPNPYGLPPVLVGAFGPRMSAMAAEVADGILVHPFSSERFVAERMMPAVADGLARAGRDRREFTMVANVVVVTGRDDEEMAMADAGVRALLAFYASTPAYRPLLELEGLDALHADLHRLSREASPLGQPGQGRLADMAALVDDDVLARFAVRGEPHQVAKAVLARAGDVADRINLYLPYAAGTDLLADVRAGFRRA